MTVEPLQVGELCATPPIVLAPDALGEQVEEVVADAGGVVHVERPWRWLLQQFERAAVGRRACPSGGSRRAS